MEYTFTFRIFEQLALALKNRVCPENFQARGGGRPPALPPHTPMSTKALIIRACWNARILVNRIKLLFLSLDNSICNVS